MKNKYYFLWFSGGEKDIHHNKIIWAKNAYLACLKFVSKIPKSLTGIDEEIMLNGDIPIYIGDYKIIQEFL